MEQEQVSKQQSWSYQPVFQTQVLGRMPWSHFFLLPLSTTNRFSPGTHPITLSNWLGTCKNQIQTLSNQKGIQSSIFMAYDSQKLIPFFANNLAVIHQEINQINPVHKDLSPTSFVQSFLPLLPKAMEHRCSSNCFYLPFQAGGTLPYLPYGKDNSQKPSSWRSAA